MPFIIRDYELDHCSCPEISVTQRGKFDQGRVCLKITILCLVSLLGSFSWGQVKQDSVEKKSLTKKAFQQGLRLISTHPDDTVVNEKSTQPYNEFKGKIIRHIDIDRIGFEKSIYDSAKRVDKWVTKLSNALHVDTRQQVIRKHLFLKPNEPLNPSKLADNERFLRDKDFILDCRIVVTPIEGTDSVDLTVITRDVFSIGGTLGGSPPKKTKFGIYDANVDGRAQRIEFNSLLHQDRVPMYGYSLLYRKSSVLGSLTNLDLGYTQTNSGWSAGDEDEFAFYARLNRPLVSPYTRMAGGLEVSRNWSENVHAKPDSIFLNYHYTIFDSWLGYNIGINKKFENRNRQFLAIRYINGYYLDQPDQEQYLELRRYNNLYGYLGEFTLYRQNFYKTRYVFGFGRTEDIPYGFTFGVSGGYIKEVHVERPYSAIKFNYGAANRKGNFLKLQAEVGGYYGNEQVEDITLVTGVSYFTRLFQLNRYKLRNLVSVNYSQMFNRQVLEWLRLGKYEVAGLSTDSLFADKRLALHAESALYTPWTLIGFRFAPFTAVDVAGVDCVQSVRPSDLFWGFSAGIRTRNENLIFGTMEMKMTYIPEDEYGKSKFVFGFRQNLRVKNSGSFVKAPSLVKYNN